MKIKGIILAVMLSLTGSMVYAENASDKQEEKVAAENEVRGVSIYPLRLDFYNKSKQMKGEKENTKVIYINNKTDDWVGYEINIKEWKTNNPKDLVDTKDIIAYPPVIKIKPNSTQSVKFIAKTGREDVEKTYRAIFNQVELKEFKPEEGKVNTRIMVGMSIPLFVEPIGEAHPEISIKKDVNNMWIVKNTGKRTEKFTKVISNGKEENLLMYALPNSEAKLQLNGSADSIVLKSESGKEYK